VRYITDTYIQRERKMHREITKTNRKRDIERQRSIGIAGDTETKRQRIEKGMDRFGRQTRAKSCTISVRVGAC
jgi:hypothetical protein